jgi:hypothetical protein
MATLMMTIDSDVESLGYQEPDKKRKKTKEQKPTKDSDDDDAILLGHNVLMDDIDTERMPNG